MEGNHSNADELKIKIRSVLLSSKQGVKKSDFLGEYTQLTGEGINVKQLGYKSLADFMASIPDTVVGRGDSYSAVSTESTDHLEKLIQRQKGTYDKSRRTGYSRTRKDMQRQPPPGSRRYGRGGSGPHVVVHKKSVTPGRRYKKHVSPSRPHTHGRYPYNANNKFKPPSKMLMSVPPRLPGKNSPLLNTTTTYPNSVKMKVLSILCRAADGLHVSVLQKQYRFQTGKNIPFVEYGYSSIGDLMSGFMWNNFKCIHSGDFYFAVRTVSGASSSNNRSIHINNNNNDNNDNNNNNNDVVGNNRQPARNGVGPMWGSGSCSNSTTNPSAHFNSKHRSLSFRDSSDNKRNMLFQSSETNGVMQNRRFFHPNERPNNRNIHRDKKQTANNRGKQAISSIDDYEDQEEERYINNRHSFDDSSYGEPDSPTTTSSSYHQGPPHHRLSRSDITRSELPSDASSSSEYLPTALGSFKKNFKLEANNNNPRNRTYSNNSGGVGSNGSQPLEDLDDDDSPWDEHPMSFPSSGELQTSKNSFDSISSGLRFKKGRGCGRGYGLSSYIGETSPAEEGSRLFPERSVALPDNWNSSEKLSFEHGNIPLENLIISIRNTSISDKKPPALDMMGHGLGRGRGRTRKT